MRFSTVIVGAFAAITSAQSSSTAAPSSSIASAPTSASVSIDPAQTSASAAILACLEKCAASDVNCKARCVPVPHPTFENVEKMQQCVADCDKQKGNGTEADNTKYGNCVAGCIGRNYYSATIGGAPSATTGSGSGSGGGSGGSSGSGNPTGASGGGASNTSGGGAANTQRPGSGAQSLHVGVSAVGLLAFLAAFAAF